MKNELVGKEIRLGEIQDGNLNAEDCILENNNYTDEKGITYFFEFVRKEEKLHESIIKITSVEEFQKVKVLINIREGFNTPSPVLIIGLKMIDSIINRIEEYYNIEDLALDNYSLQDCTYILVDNGEPIYLKKDEFERYKELDFYSLVISNNKKVDLKKQIASNNYLSFFFKDKEKLNVDIISGYYSKLNAPGKYKDWILSNYNSLESKYGLPIKIFFREDVAKYKYLADKYLKGYLFGSGNETGTSIFINTNPKKPFLGHLTRGINPFPIIDIETGIKHYYLERYLRGFISKGKRLVYFGLFGEITAYSNKEKIDYIPNSPIFAAIDVGEKGDLIIKDYCLIANMNENFNKLSYKQVEKD